MAQARGKKRDHTGIAGVRVKGERRIRIADGRVRARARVSGRVTVRGGARAGKAKRAFGGITCGTLEEDLLEAASKVRSNKRGNRERAAKRRARMEEAFNSVSEVSRGACGPVVTCGLIRCIQ